MKGSEPTAGLIDEIEPCAGERYSIDPTLASLIDVFDRIQLRHPAAHDQAVDGRPAAVDEACRILTEKAVAVGGTSVRAARGKWPLTMALAYRKTVRNNLRRLSR